MVGRIVRTGDGLVVSLPEKTLEVLGLTEGAEVSVVLDQEGGRIIIGPVGTLPEGVDEAFAHQVAEFIAQYRPALEALARA